jgi:hypothetical protein
MANLKRLRKGLRVIQKVQEQQLSFDLRSSEIDAIGWIANDSWHRGQGLRLIRLNEGEFTPTFDENRGDFALACYFELSITTTPELFNLDNHRFSEKKTPQFMIDRIRALIEHEEPETLVRWHAHF